MAYISQLPSIYAFKFWFQFNESVMSQDLQWTHVSKRRSCPLDVKKKGSGKIPFDGSRSTTELNSPKVQV